MKAAHIQDAIYPGQPWMDTKGERIQAHGGAVYYEDGVYSREQRVKVMLA